MRLLPPSLARMCLTLALALGASSSAAQDVPNTFDLFEEVGTQRQTFSPRAIERLARVRLNAASVGERVVNVRDGAALIGAGAIRVQVQQGRPAVFQRDFVSVNAPGDFGWFGVLVSPDSLSVGTLSLTVRGGEVFGSAMIDGETHQIQALDRRQHVFTRLDTARVPRIVPDNPSMGMLMPRIAPPVVQGSASNAGSAIDDGSCDLYTCRVRVLVLYTAAAAASVSDIHAVISAGFNESNNAYNRSRTEGLSIVEAGRAQVSFNEGGPEPILRDRIFADLDEMKARFASLRDQYKADLYVLLTEAVYGGVSGSVREFRLEDDNAHAIVVARYAVSSQIGDYTFAHEVGHLFAAQHNRSVAGPQVNYPYEYGHRFKHDPGIFSSTRRWRTIMSYQPQYGESSYGNSYTQIANFSNPNVRHDSEPTGTSGEDNAQVLRNTKGIIAGYRLDPFTASIFGEAEVQQGYTYTYAAIVNRPASSVSSYEWSVSPNGFTDYTVISTSSTVQLTINAPEPFYLRLVVTAGTETSTSFYYVYVRPGGECGPQVACSVQPAAEAVVPTRSDVRSLAPNPSRGLTQVQVDLPEQRRVEAAVYDLLGRQVLSVPASIFGAGTHPVTFDVAALPAGVYLCRIQADSQVLTRRFVVAR